MTGPIQKTSERNSAFTKWLKGQGKFDEYQKHRKELESKGLSKTEAWQSAALEYGYNTFDAADTPAEPEPEPDDPDLDAAYAALAARSRSGGSNPLDDLRWAYDHMALRSIEPVDAPSMGALAWWEFARDARLKFLEIVGKHLLKAPDEEDRRRQDDSRTHFEVIDRLLEEEGAI